MKVHYQINTDKELLYAFCITFLVSFLFLPLFVFAANNDVSLQSGTEITANGVTVTIAQSGVESITVSTGNFTVDMPVGAARVSRDIERSFAVRSALR